MHGESATMGNKLGNFFRQLVGGGGDADEGASSDAPSTEYKGYAIRPACRREGSQWLTVGVISKTFDDGVREHEFIRADFYASKDDAEACAITKAKRIIDEQGDCIFS